MNPGGQAYITPKGRIIGFDFLRSIAIFLTLCRHSNYSPKIFHQIGWVGVHLFFVLSSFLILNILLTEYYNKGKINFFRFFMRRSLKIYPLYYLFIAVSVFKNRDLLSPAYNLKLLGQIFHLQNYTDLLWYHSWSLAAEEHFYIGMCIVLAVFLFLSKSGTPRNITWLFIGIIALVPLLRYRDTLQNHTDWFIPTHYIMDSFAVGALLALSKFVFPAIFSKIIQLKHFLLIPIAILFIPLFMLPPGNLLMNSIGLSINFLAAALLIAYFLAIEQLLRDNKNIFSVLIIQPLAALGLASYSIYLLHVPVKTIVEKVAMPEWLIFPAYLIACMVVGKLAWYLIERPIASYKSRFLADEKPIAIL